MKEDILDISPEAADEALKVWRRDIVDLQNYLLTRLDKYTHYPTITPLWNRAIQNAVEYGRQHQMGGMAQEIQLLGSLCTLDALDINAQQTSGTPLEVTRNDRARYDQLAEDYLVDPRWKTMYQVKDGVKFVRPDRTEDFMALMRETGGPTTDISTIRDVLQSRGRNRLIDTVDECAGIWMDNLDIDPDPDQRSGIKYVFNNGMWAVIPILAVKHGGQLIERELLARRMHKATQQN